MCDRGLVIWTFLYMRCFLYEMRLFNKLFERFTPIVELWTVQTFGLVTFAARFPLAGQP